MATVKEVIQARAFFPGKQWGYDFSKEGYAGLTWLDESPKPTEKEFNLLLSSFSPEPPAPTPKPMSVEQVVAALEKKNFLTRADVEAESK